MEKFLTHLLRKDNWLIGYDINQFNSLTQQLFQQLQNYETPPKILLIENNPFFFLAAFLAATATNSEIFLCNPNWVESEWEQVFALVQPDLIFSNNLPTFISLTLKNASNINYVNLNNIYPLNPVIFNQPKSSEASPEINNLPNSPLPNHLILNETKSNQAFLNLHLNQSQKPQTNKLDTTSRTEDFPTKIMIPTGGTSGKIRFAIHTWSTLTASVTGFFHYFEAKPVNSFCILPLYHVSGLMQFLRSLITNGKILILPYKTFKATIYENRLSSHNSIFNLLEIQDYFISLVPTQLQFILEKNPAWLAKFKTVLLGGAPAWEALLVTARKQNIKLAPTYGMTETASQIITLKPNDFLAGNSSSGKTLPHAQVLIYSDEHQILPPNKIGKIAINTASLCLGYYPQISQNHKYFLTDDLGFFDNQGYLNIVGRSSKKIITGGENVFPSEVEAAILATNLITDVCVIGLLDKTWGQVVCAIYVPKNTQISETEIKTALNRKLSKYKQPKKWITVTNLPRNPQGKINYQQIKKIALSNT
ncbi:MAG: 2-succinylbenzoate--CoA ligase, partial [Oscillatoria sp. PMC 1076.18]|nr:2-succinylbenzoate--CoA ligase [Oscillatoria sp. PMC 1076.18]